MARAARAGGGADAVVGGRHDRAPDGPPLPDDVLAGDPATAWSGLTIKDMTPWSDVYLWLAGFEPGFCRLDQSGGPQLAGGGPVVGADEPGIRPGLSSPHAKSG